MITQANDPFDQATLYTNLNTIYIAIHSDEKRNEFISILEPYGLQVYDANRRPDRLIDDFKIPCLARFIDAPHFESLGARMIQYFDNTGDMTPIFILAKCQDERLAHPKVFYLLDMSPADFVSIFDRLISEADRRFMEAHPFPRTKEFVICSIHNPQLAQSVTDLLLELEAPCLSTSIDEESFIDLLLTDCFFRLIDWRTYTATDTVIHAYLKNELNPAPFIIVDPPVPIPFEHPQLLRLQDVSKTWLATKVIKGREWDHKEVNRYKTAQALSGRKSRTLMQASNCSSQACCSNYKEK